jgi:hypothetical protein
MRSGLGKYMAKDVAWKKKKKKKKRKFPGVPMF